MYQKTFDYHTEDKQQMDEIEAMLAARTPEQLIADQAEARLSFQKMIAKYEQYQATQKRVPNNEKYRSFLFFAEQMRKYTKIHNGKIKITAEENGLGLIEMYFDGIFHTDTDHSRSRFLFGMIFLRYEETYITVRDDGIFVQIFADLYDIEVLSRES